MSAVIGHDSDQRGSGAAQEATRASLDASAAEPANFPCSIAQERFWLLDRLEPGNPAYNVAVRWRLEGKISAALIEQAWDEIVHRHEILRTIFVEEDGKPLQRVLPHRSFRITEIDLSALAESDRIAEADRIGLIEARAPFDLANGPLIRVTLLHLRPTEAILLVTSHQAVCDGWSVGIMAREMGEVYRALMADEPNPLPDLALQYGDYASWQLEWLGARGTDKEQAYWSRQLAGLQPFEVAPDLPRPATPTTRGAIESIVLSRGLTDAAQALSNEHGATLFAAALATLCATLARYTDRNEIVLGTQVSDRDQIELEPMIGQFVTSLVLRIRLSDDPTFAKLIERMRDTTADALENRHISIERLLDMVKAERHGTASAPISINFIFQKSFVETVNYGELRLVDLPSLPSGAIYDLNFFMVERPDGWRFSCQYNTDQFHAATARRLLHYCKSLLEQALAAPHRHLSELIIDDGGEGERLIGQLNATSGQGFTTPTQTVPELLRTRLSQMSGTAVWTPQGTWSYQQLAEASARLVQALGRQGIAPGARVAVMAQTPIEQLLAIIAVLRAGASLVLLDTSVPLDLALLVQAGVAAILTRTDRAADFAALSVPVMDILASESLSPATDGNVADARIAPDQAALVRVSTQLSKSYSFCEISQAALAQVLAAVASRARMAPHHVGLVVPTAGSETGAVAMLLPLLYGGGLIVSGDLAPRGRDLAALLEQHHGRLVFASAEVLSSLVQADWRSREPILVLCDAPIGRTLAKELLGRGELWVLRGWSASSLWSSMDRTEDALVAACIRPLPLSTFQLVNQSGSSPPLGAIGQIQVQAHSVGGDTAMQLTGELGRVTPEGRLELIGSAETARVLHGRLLDTERVRAVLLQAGAREASVQIICDPLGEAQCLGARVVPEDQSSLQTTASSEALIAQLKQRLDSELPAWMVPTDWRIVASIPRVRHGRWDEQASVRTSNIADNAAQPMNELERQLERLWASVLGVAEVDCTANFFEMGGHSLLAARMLARVQALFGRQITLATLFRGPTIRNLARALQSDRRQLDFRQVVKLQANGTRPPLLAINNTGNYYGLAKQLGPDQPFTSLQLFDPSIKTERLPGTLEEMAAQYVELIGRVQPRGPYALLGWCAAGALALEIASQMAAAGKQVSTLFLLDSWVPRYFERLNPVRRWIAERSLRWQWLLDDWRLKKDRSDGWAWFWSRRPTLARLLALAAVPVKPPDQDEYALAAHDEWLLQYLQELTRKYEPKPYHGKIVLIRSYQEPTGWWFEKNAGWASFAAGGLQLHMVQGNHFTMFREPGVLKLAACVRTALDEGKSVPIKAARPAVARQPITTSLTPQRPGAGSAT